jgi:hypothetical protein
LPPFWAKCFGNAANGKDEAIQKTYHNPPEFPSQGAYMGLLNAKLTGSQVSFPMFTDDAANHIPQPEWHQPGLEVVAKETFHRFLGGFAAKPVHMGHLEQPKLGNVEQ